MKLNVVMTAVDLRMVQRSILTARGATTGDTSSHLVAKGVHEWHVGKVHGILKHAMQPALSKYWPPPEACSRMLKRSLTHPTSAMYI